jgi:uncharacterized protein
VAAVRSGGDGSQSAGTIEMLVLQSTPFCNLDCAYCYLPNRSSRKRMNERTMERTFQCVFMSPFVADQLTILWHAGEPLVPGVDYYQRAFALLERCRPAHVTVKHNFQTNATLIDERWINFFRAHANVSVGVSIDGPARLHDQHRKTRSGGGSHAQVMRGVRALQDAGLPFHVITVLTRDSLREARALFNFYVEHGITQVAFNIEEIEGDHVSSSLALDGIDEAMRAFLREFIDLTHAHAAKLEVRELLGAFAGIANPDSSRYGNPMAQPMRVVSIGVDGEISTFSPELLGYGNERHGAFVFGNVHDNELADILDGPGFRAIEAEINRGLARCRDTCDYFEVCRGGSPVNKLFENGSFDSTETLFCRLSKKAVIDVVLERLERTFELAS